MSAERLARLPNRRVVLVVLAIVAIGAILLFTVFPTRSYFAQRAERAERRAELAEIDAQLTGLQARVEALGTDEEIERLAREQYHLVYPDEESYTILPPPVTVTSPPAP